MKFSLKIAPVAILAAATMVHAGPIQPHVFATSDARFLTCIRSHQANERIVGDRPYYATGRYLDWRWKADEKGRVMELKPIGDGHTGKDMETSSWLRDAMWGCSPKDVKPDEEGIITWQIRPKD